MTATLDDYDSNIAELIASVRAGPVIVSEKPVVLTSDMVADAYPAARIQHPITITAFTILEVIIALTIGILIMGVSTLAITGIQSEHDLKNSATDIESNARGMLLKAIGAHRTMQMPFNGLGENVEIMRYGEKKFRKPAADEQWEFSPTGVCEPIDIRITSERGTIEMSFDPLTACARKKNVTVKS